MNIQMPLESVLEPAPQVPEPETQDGKVPGGEAPCWAADLGVALPKALLELALTHPSAVGEGIERTLHSNQRLEFLGDAVLGLVVAEYLFRNEPDLPEGALTQRKAAVVQGRSLAAAAGRLNLGRFLNLGVGEAERGGRNRESILADALEAIIGAIFLANGLDAAREFVVRIFAPEMESAAGNAVNVKNRLQEITQANGMGTPVYESEVAGGPAHLRQFSAWVIFGGRERGRGAGLSKKEAECAAAAAALEGLESSDAAIGLQAAGGL